MKKMMKKKVSKKPVGKTIPPKKTVAKKVSAKPAVSKKETKGKDPIFDLVRNMYQAAEDVKAIDPCVLDLRKISSVADYIFIASASSDRQVKAIAERIEESAKKKLKRMVLSREGVAEARWILLDYGDVICHLFIEEARDFYRLEQLWHDAKRVSSSQLR